MSLGVVDPYDQMEPSVAAAVAAAAATDAAAMNIVICTTTVQAALTIQCSLAPMPHPPSYPQHIGLTRTKPGHAQIDLIANVHRDY